DQGHQRVAVGAAGRFELSVESGVIVAMQGEDARNLTLPSGLGPWPLALPENWTDSKTVIDPREATVLRPWASGTSVVRRQTVVEPSPFRVAVRGDWPFLSGAGP